MKILILCTGNSCRSQMAESILNSFDSRIDAVSAGTNPADFVHPKAVEVLNEIGLDLSNSYPKNVEEFILDDFDYVITVCGGANESCPAFIGNVKNRIHIGFDDPAEAIGTNEQITKEFRRIRDEIEHDFRSYYNEQLKPLL